MMVCVLFVALNAGTKFAMEFDRKSVKEDAVLRKNPVTICPLFAMLGVFAVLSRDAARSLVQMDQRSRRGVT